MPETDLNDLAFSWSTLFVRSLYKEGIRHAVLSPGSRSTALTLAFSAHPGIEKHLAIDERSAAFMAMGMGKASGVPAVLVCTSGTAVANYYPAVIEATQSGVPLLVASADRPPHYRSVGASQTIDQLKIFGDYPVFFHEVGEPVTHANGRERLALAAHQAVYLSKEQKGVSHLNFAFSKPFEPSIEMLSQTEQENQDQLKAIQEVSYTSSGVTYLPDEFWSDLKASKRPLILVGPASSSQDLHFVNELALRLKAPVLAEPGSQVPSSANTIEGFDGFLRNKANHEILRSDLILRFGPLPVSKAIHLYLDSCTQVRQMVFGEKAKLPLDGSLSADQHIPINGAFHIPDFTGSAGNSWLHSWLQAEKDFKAERSELLEQASNLTDGFIFNKVSEATPQQAFTMLSNSFPVRDMSMFGHFGGKKMYANRGAAGIDGILSTTVGLSISSKAPGVLFIGDIAFLHDSNALLLAKEIQHPLVIVVINNGGGTIFRMLPVHKIQSKYERYFETPQTTDIQYLCQAHHIHHSKVSNPDQILPIFTKLIQEDGLHVIECKTDADYTMQQREQLWNFKVKPHS